MVYHMVYPLLHQSYFRFNYIGLTKGLRSYGAVEKTRTSTGVTPQRPQRCASTNSATTALITMGNRQVFRECEAEISTFLISLVPEPQARIPFK